MSCFFSRSIGSASFNDCDKLHTVTFVKTSQLETIRNSAFANCSDLKKIIIPLSVKTIEANAFSDLTRIIDIYCEVESKPVGFADGWDNKGRVTWGYTGE